MRWDVPSVADCTLHSHLHIFAVDPSPRPKIVGTDRKTNPRGDLLMRSIHLSLFLAGMVLLSGVCWLKNRHFTPQVHASGVAMEGAGWPAG